MEPGDLLVYQFSQRKVEIGNTSHFMGMFALEKLPTGSKLRKMMGNMMICIDGYDDDERELYEIPEVRQFYRKFSAEWPYSFYFSNLDQGALKIQAYCNIEHLTDLKVKGDSQVLVRPHPKELFWFMSKSFASMNVICHRANMFEALICLRSQQLLAYFGMGDDATSPGIFHHPQ